MKSLLLGSASVAAVLLGLAGSANAQVAIDIGEISDVVGALTPTVGDITVDVDALNGVEALPAGVNGAYLNTAVNLAPQINANLQVGTPIDATGAVAVLGAVAAAAGDGPLTDSAAIAFDPTELVDALGSSITTGAITQTAVGLLVNQGNQSGTTAITTVVDNSTSFVNEGTNVTYFEATTAAARAGTAAADSSATVAGSLTTGGFTSNVNELDRTVISGAALGVYASNLAANVAPQINANVQVASDLTTGALSQTGVGVLANQVNSIGLDGAALAGSITGNSTPATTTPGTGTGTN